jgi:hypothetical protein
MNKNYSSWQDKKLIGDNAEHKIQIMKFT